jgi:exodeoxyribonuclease VII large subunit
VLARGFAVVYGADGRALKMAADMPPGAAVTIEMQDGRRSALIGGGDGKPSQPRRSGSSPAPKASKQEELF